MGKKDLERKHLSRCDHSRETKRQKECRKGTSEGHISKIGDSQRSSQKEKSGQPEKVEDINFAYDVLFSTHSQFP